MSTSKLDLIILQPAAELEAEVGLPAGFLNSLLEEDDWSFIVKAHALIEAAMTHALVQCTGLSAAENFFARLDLSGGQIGKAKLASDLGLVTPWECKFIRKLSEIRNDFVHDVKNAGVSLNSYFGSHSPDKNQGKSWAESLSWVDFDREGWTLPKHEAQNAIVNNPKKAIWMSTVFLVAVVQLKVGTDRALRLAAEYEQQIGVLAKQGNLAHNLTKTIASILLKKE